MNIDSGEFRIEGYNTYDNSIELSVDQVNKYKQYYSKICIWSWVWANGENKTATGWVHSYTSCVYPIGTPTKESYTIAEAYAKRGSTATDDGSLTVMMSDAYWISIYTRVSTGKPGKCSGVGRTICKVWLQN